MFGQKNIGDILLDAQRITESQLRTGVNEQKRWGSKLGEALLRLGYITEEVLVWALRQQLKVPAIDLKRVDITKEVLKIYPKKLLLRLRALPVGFKKLDEREFLVVAMADPTNLDAIDELKFASSHSILPVLAGPNTLERALKFYLEDQDKAIDLDSNHSSSYHFRMSLDQADGNRTVNQETLTQNQDRMGELMAFPTDEMEGFGVRSLINQTKSGNSPPHKADKRPADTDPLALDKENVLSSDILDIDDALVLPKPIAAKRREPLPAPPEKPAAPVIPRVPAPPPPPAAAPATDPASMPAPAELPALSLQPILPPGVNLHQLREEVNALWRVVIHGRLIEHNQLVALLKSIRDKK